jgi:hypothetical protein
MRAIIAINVVIAVVFSVAYFLLGGKGYDLLLLGIGAVLSACVGMPFGVFANSIHEERKISQKKKSLEQLVGLWIEHFPEAEQGQFSLGAFDWDNESNDFRYDGTRFRKDGAPIYHWSSQSLFCDHERRTIIYIYQIENIDETAARGDEEKFYGLGQIMFRKETGSGLELSGGFFSDCDTGRHVRLNMERFKHRNKPIVEKLDRKSRIEIGRFYGWDTGGAAAT